VSRLPRPTPTFEDRCRVALCQLGEFYPDAVIDAHRCDRTVAPQHRMPGLRALLDELLVRLAALLGCEVSDLRLDHDPALENRAKVYDESGWHVEYVPPANDPDHLRYRPHGPEFVGSHLIKTNVRGDHGAHSDRALAAKNKNIARNRDPDHRKVKIRSASRWPPKGARKFRGK